MRCLFLCLLQKEISLLLRDSFIGYSTGWPAEKYCIIAKTAP